MQRSIKYGLYGTVLSLIVGASSAWSSTDRSVHLVVDGIDKTVETSAPDVAGVLAQSGYKVRPHDIVAPAVSTKIHNGSRVVLRRARLLHLDINGRAKDVWTTAPTVAQALSQLGYTQDDFVSVSRSSRLPLGATSIAVRTPKVLTVVHDGKRQHVSTTAATVGQLLTDLNLTLHPLDRISAPVGSLVHRGERITLVRVVHKGVTRYRQVSPPVRRIDDPGLAMGQTQVVKPGQNGRERVSYVVIYVDGKPVGRSKAHTVTVSRPQRRVVRVGTKPTAGTSPSAAQQYAQSLLPSYGWGNDQFSCLVTMWNHESGWNYQAQNPSGAYGIPQALPGSKMGSGWQDDPAVQIRWGLHYIQSRYGTPCDAWAFWQQGSWY